MRNKNTYKKLNAYNENKKIKENFAGNGCSDYNNDRASCVYAKCKFNRKPGGTWTEGTCS
jgi:hypothetical protein